MYKIVLDTNVLFSAFSISTGAPKDILLMWKNGTKFNVVLSEYILFEFRLAMNKKLHFSFAYLDLVIESIKDRSILVNPMLVTHNNVLPNDWPILGTATAASADFLVSGDKRLLNLKHFYHTSIISPVDFLKLF